MQYKNSDGRADPGTVGGMIAQHHWRAALFRRNKDWQLFVDTPLGAAFHRFELAARDAAEADAHFGLVDSWVAERKAAKAEAAYQLARDELLTLIRIASQ